MYAIYKQTHQPTGVEHCVNCNFFSSSELNLVIAAVNQIHVYRLYAETEVCPYHLPVTSYALSPLLFEKDLQSYLYTVTPQKDK